DHRTPRRMSAWSAWLECGPAHGGKAAYAAPGKRRCPGSPRWPGEFVRRPRALPSRHPPRARVWALAFDLSWTSHATPAKRTVEVSRTFTGRSMCMVAPCPLPALLAQIRPPSALSALAHQCRPMPQLVSRDLVG